ncbi:MAG: TolC family outer membrane protein [Gammaproteobacteria bacterium]|nr:TolC family outer membrane protein [Gammaproteobacteria bacterium]
MSCKSFLIRTCIVGVLLLPFSTRADDLWQVYQLALDNDPEYRAARLNYEATQENVPQARSSLLPSVTAGAAHNRRTDDISSDAEFITDGRATFNRETAQISLTQSIFDKPSKVRLTQAELEVEQAAVQFENAWESLATRVAIRYFAVLATQDSLEVAMGEKKAIQRQMELARERLEVGLGTRTEVFDAEARFQLAEAEEIQARNRIDDALQALEEVTGVSPQQLDKLRDDAPLDTPQPNNTEDWIGRALNDNTSIKAQVLGVDIAKQEIVRQRSGRLPLVDFNLNQNFSDSDGSVSGPGSDAHSRDVIVQLSVPLYSGGLINSSTRQAALRYDASQQDLESAQRATRRATRASFLDVVTSIKRVAALQQAIVASESAVRAKEEGFAAGLNTNVDVLDAQRDLFGAKRDYLQARYNYILNVIALERAAGSLDEDDLGRVNDWLQ